MAPPAKGPLDRYRLLSPSASLRVSPLCLGAMNFGKAWESYMGACDQKTTENILDYFYEQGGNFIDTANNYQFGESEMWIGEWMKKRGNRDEMGKYPAWKEDLCRSVMFNVSPDPHYSSHRNQIHHQLYGGAAGRRTHCE